MRGKLSHISALVKNLSIGSRLFAGFLIMIGLLVVVSAVALTEMWSLSALTSEMYHHPLTVGQAVRDAHTTLVKMRVGVHALVMARNPEDLEAALQRINTLEDQMYAYFEVIRDRFLGESQDVEAAEQLFAQWKPIRDDIIALKRANKPEEAVQALNEGKGQQHFIRLEQAMTVLTEFTSHKAGEFFQSSETHARDAYIVTLVLLGIAVIAGVGIAFFISRTITHPLQTAVELADQVSEGNLDAEFTTTPAQDEVGRVLRALQNMVQYIRDVAIVAEKVSNQDLQIEITPKSAQDTLNISLQRMVTTLQVMLEEIEHSMGEIEQQSWLKDGLNQLNNQLLGEAALQETCQKAVSFVTRYVQAGSGVLYTYDSDQHLLQLCGSFAAPDEDMLLPTCRLGEGVIGQVAADRKPLLLKNLSRADRLINTGTVSEPPLNTYTFPLAYNDELYGVLEIASFEQFTSVQQNFLDEANRVIAMVLASAFQRERVQQLLQTSQQATREAEQAAHDAQQAKEDAQQKAAEAQRANAQLEEQQQRLQQQSEELQQINAHLEEQQQQVEQQREELSQQNQNLQSSKAELDRRTQELETASQDKTEFLANMSHELRTPLTSITLVASILKKNEAGNLTDKDLRQLQIIQQSGEQLLQLLNDILLVGRIEAGKVEMEPTDVTTGEVLQRLREKFEPKAVEHNLEFRLRDDLGATLRTDPDKLEQIFNKLMAYVFQTGSAETVTVAVPAPPPRPDTVQMSVIATGLNLPDDQQRLITETLRQTTGPLSKNLEGNVLSFSIVREYARLLHGKIAFTSQPEQGGVFTLTLPKTFENTALLTEEVSDQPAAPASLPDTEKSDEGVAEQGPTLVAGSPVEDDRETVGTTDNVILIIEDNADLAQSMMDIPRSMGFKALVALNGYQGLALARQFRPTGILLDLVLPDINGIEVLRELKSTRELRHIPVHIMSSKDPDNTFRNIGAVGYDQKPVNDTDIQQAIEHLVSVSKKYPKRLLIVEDDEAQREAIQDLVGDNEAIQTTGVSSQTEAIAALQENIYDAAIIDLGLQDGSGYDICRYIQEQQIALPVIIYTGRDLTEAEERELRTYTDSIIIKTAQSHERLLDEVAIFLHQMSQDTDSDQAPDESGRPPSAPQPSGINLAGKTILIVDDDVKNVFILTSALEEHGAAVVDALDGEAALATLRQRPDIDLVLMDVMMPGMDGYATMQQIRQDEQLQHLPIIALTAKALKEDRQKCIQAGADDYLSKPIDYDGLLRLVSAWIEKA